MKRKKSPITKIYEALGAMADGRVHVDGNTAQVYSSSGNKYYDAIYDPEANSITANDNGSYWVGYLGYPNIALLMALGVIKHDPKVATWLGGVAWKDINTKFKNDFDKTEQFVRNGLVSKPGFDVAVLDRELANIAAQIDKLDLNRPTARPKPPTGY